MPMLSLLICHCIASDYTGVQADVWVRPSGFNDVGTCGFQNEFYLGRVLLLERLSEERSRPHLCFGAISNTLP